MTDPRAVDPEYDRHGGFPNFEAVEPGPGFGRFLTAMRRAQDLAVSADPDADTWEQAADTAEKLVSLLEPFEAGEGVGPANRVPKLPGAGSLLMPPYRAIRFAPDGVELEVTFSRFSVGGNSAVHGGVLPLLFDSVFGMVIHAARAGTASTKWQPPRRGVDRSIPRQNHLAARAARATRSAAR